MHIFQGTAKGYEGLLCGSIVSRIIKRSPFELFLGFALVIPLGSLVKDCNSDSNKKLVFILDNHSIIEYYNNMIVTGTNGGV
ncbi:MAG: hypothetical protein ACOX6G_09220 [Christensenellales bacterium]|jgi:hypothetical protein